MEIKNIKIRTQLKFGFGSLLVFIILLGVIAYIQANKIHAQTELLYNHPMKVKSAIASIEIDILKIRIGKKDLQLSKIAPANRREAQLIELSLADAVQQFSLLNEAYLGPQGDVEEAYRAFVLWNSLREVNMINQVFTDDTETIYIESLMEKIYRIEKFANSKGGELYLSSGRLTNSLNKQLVLLVFSFSLLSLSINYFLRRSIYMPIDDLTNAARKFNSGDIHSRSLYVLKNEFGVLSDSFNNLAAGIEDNMNLNVRTTKLVEVMLSEDEALRFFHNTLEALSDLTGSQMAAVYLRSDNKESFEYFESIGMDENAQKSFSACNYEGELGSALASRKVLSIKHIAENTRFVFNTVCGKLIPNEIITIPIVAANEIIAIISLASVSVHDKIALQLIDSVLGTLSARVEGILAYRKINEFSQKLEIQNKELDLQKNELASQWAEMMQQNVELEIQKNQLDEASRLKTNFLSNMSHELRTPLNSVIALSGVLSRQLVNQIPPEEYSYLEVIERNGKHLLSLINDILDISRIEAGKEEIELTEFNVNDLVEDVVRMIRPQAQQKNIELLHTITNSVPTINSDAHKCRHILQNLIGNAVKFTEKGRVEVVTREKNNMVEIAVIDTGIGIEESHLSHIFDEFRQADSSTSRRFGGTGLGLSIARKYAGLLGGSVTVASVPGEGSEFTLVLPLVHADTLEIKESKKENSETSDLQNVATALLQPPKKVKKIKGKPVVLVVEKNPETMLRIKTLLADKYTILEAGEGPDGIEIAQKTLPNLILLDIEFSGIDTFWELQNNILLQDIPVIALTESEFSSNPESLISQGFTGYLVKSIEQNVFCKTIEQVLYGE